MQFPSFRMLDLKMACYLVTGHLEIPFSGHFFPVLDNQYPISQQVAALLPPDTNLRNIVLRDPTIVRMCMRLIDGEIEAAMRSSKSGRFHSIMLDGELVELRSAKAPQLRKWLLKRCMVFQNNLRYESMVTLTEDYLRDCTDSKKKNETKRNLEKIITAHAKVA